jgi:hypothetical protein
MRKSTKFIVVGVHTALILATFPYELLSKSHGESWTFFFPFFVDFPISIIFHKILGLIKEINSKTDIGLWWLTFSHFVFGAIWWLLIAKGISASYNLLKRKIKADKPT